uniref:Uncharacterized protein n=1 Tax=Anguilla anguilla TaxID=7936 RepID=A0A0E9RDJ1_ANGAN
MTCTTPLYFLFVNLINLPCSKSNSTFLTLDNLLIINEDKHATSQYSSTTFYIIIYPKQSTAWHLLPPYQYYSFQKNCCRFRSCCWKPF